MTKYRSDYRATFLLALVTCLISSPSWATPTGELIGWGDNIWGQSNVPVGNDFMAIATEYSFGLALKSDGSLSGWGYNGSGQTNVPVGNDFAGIAAGVYHGLALKSDGSLAGWGFNGNGQTDVPVGDDFVAVAAGWYHSLALKSDGSLAGWGLNFDGQTNVPAGNDFVAVDAGLQHSLALKFDGSLAGWGSNGSGQTNVPAGNDFVAIAAGYQHGLALKSDGSLAGWGSNVNGQTNVPAGYDFVAVAAGGDHSLALKADGSLVGWGNNDFGQSTVPAGNNFVAIAAGVYHSLAIQVPEPTSLALVAFGAVAFAIRRRRRIALLSLCCALSVTSAAHTAQYTVTDLGTLGGTFSQGQDINASGQVTGESYTTGDAPYHAFLWTPTTPNGASGTVQDLGTLGGSYSAGFGINDSGQVTGQSHTTGDSAYHAFLYDGTLNDLGTLGGTYSFGTGINDSGQVAGTSSTGIDLHAFLWTPTTPNGVTGTMNDLGTFGGFNSFGLGVNDSGQVAGWSHTTGNAAQHAFLYDGTMHDLGTLGGTYSVAYGINAGGQVAGASETVADSPTHAFLWKPTTPGSASGAMHDLGTLGGSASVAYAINDSGQVVGNSLTTGGAYHAFLYTSGSGMVDLNSLIDPLSGWELDTAKAINDGGQITGQGFIGDQQHAFLLTPVVPEPSTLALIALVAAAFAVRRSRRITNALGLCCALSITAAAHAAMYTVTDLGSLGGTYNSGLGINASGQVTGYSATTDDTAEHAILWTPTTPNGTSGTLHDLGTLGGTYSGGSGINANGQVAGGSETTGDTAAHASLWTPTTPNGTSGMLHDLGTLGGTISSGTSINDSGQVAGYSDTTGDADSHAFMWKPTTPGGASGTMHDLGSLGGPFTIGWDINASGQVTGASDTTDDDYSAHAFLWKPTTPNGTSGTMHDLGTLGGTYSAAAGINDGGQVAGWSWMTEGAGHAFLWTPTTLNGTSGTMQDLGTLGGCNCGSFSYDVDAGGQVVGASYVEAEISTDTHAFLYASGNGMVDLNSLIDPLSGWELLDATDINEVGQITGQGLIDGEYHAYLLTPAIPGDFNHDGTVDAADYITWRKGLGTTYTQDDYNTWQANFGATLGSGSGATGGVPSGSSAPVVPEPPTLIMLFVAAAGVSARRRCRTWPVSQLVGV